MVLFHLSLQCRRGRIARDNLRGLRCRKVSIAAQRSLRNVLVLLNVPIAFSAHWRCITSQCYGRPRVASKVCPWYSHVSMTRPPLSTAKFPAFQSPSTGGRGLRGGVEGQSPRRRWYSNVASSAHIKREFQRIHSAWSSIKLDDSVPTVSHPKGGSRRATALLPGATPAQANKTSACVIRIGDTRLRGWITDAHVGQLALDRHQTEHLIVLEHGPCVLQYAPRDGDDRHLLASLGADS